MGQPDFHCKYGVYRSGLYLVFRNEYDRNRGKEGAGLEEIARLLESGMLDKALAAAEKTKAPQVLVYLNNAGVNYTKERR